MVDVIKPGVGTTNDGNTARKFFANPALTAEITGLNQTIIQKFRGILQAIASGQAINAHKFQENAQQLAEFLINHSYRSKRDIRSLGSPT